MKKIKTYLIFIINFIIYAITALLMKLFPKYNLKFRKLAAKYSIPLMISEIKIVGKIDKNADMFVSNHQSMIDIPLIEYILSDINLSWVAKKELGEIFLFKNLLTKSGAILIDREDKKSLIELLKNSKERLNKGQKIVIFPEGTRNKNPKKLLPFKMGPKLLAEKLNLKVQPLVLLNVRDVLQFNPLSVNRNKIIVIVLPAIKPQKGTDWYKKLEEDMQKEINKYYQ